MGPDRVTSFRTTLAFLIGVSGVSCAPTLSQKDLEAFSKIQPYNFAALKVTHIPPDLPEEKELETEGNPFEVALPRITTDIIIVREENFPLVWPTYGPIYGHFSYYHPGLDIQPPYGTPVVSAADGIVTRRLELRYGLGHHVFIYHDELNLTTVYGHLSEILVSERERVARGQMIGRVGTTGYATGPHLHFEVRIEGIPINPLGYLPR